MSDTPSKERALPEPKAGHHDAHWYLAIGDEERGPFDDDELLAKLHALHTDKKVLIWKQGMPAWQPVEENKRFASALTRPKDEAKKAVDTSEWKPEAASKLSELATDDAPPAEQQPQAESAEPEAPEATAKAPTPDTPAEPAAAAAPAATPESAWHMPDAPQRRGLSPAAVILGIFASSIVTAGAVFFVMQQMKTPAAPVPATDKTDSAEAGTDGEPKTADAAAAKTATKAPPNAAAPKAVSKPAAPSKPAVAATKPAAPAPKPAAPKPKPATSDDDLLSGATDDDDDEDEDEEEEDAAPLTTQVIVSSVQKNGRTVGPCIEKAKDSGDIEPGSYKFRLNWVIEASGRVKKPKLVAPAEIAGTPLAKCFEAAMLKWKFPKSSDGAPVKNFPLPINIR